MAAELREVGSKPRHRRRVTALMLISSAVLAGARAALGGNLQVDHVVSGSAQFTQSGTSTIIHAANRTIIDYTQFNVAAGTSVRFVQPGSESWVLNRIIKASPSHIDGTLTANGTVYLVNPAGVMFGANSIINVGQLYAAAAHLSDQDALAGINHFTASQGSVVNQGKITAADVYLVGLHVVNGGSIIAGSGTVAMVADDDVYLGDRGGGLMVKVDAGANSAASGGVGVQNGGNVAAQAVDMSAGDLYSIAIRHTGQTKAASITLDGEGTVQVSGTLDASNPGGKGGTVRVLGGRVALSDATIDASGSSGGGTVWVGGGPHGSGTDSTASITLVDNKSSIHADALAGGDGGTVVVWSDAQTVFDGAISVRGGAAWGNGGWSEVSSAQALAFAGAVDAAAPHGKLGTLLLDPHTITIASGGTAALGDVSSFSNTADETIDASAINSASANVVLQANTDIDINQSINLSTSGVSLTMQAGRSIVFASGRSITTTDGDVTLSANDNTATAANRDSGAAVISMDGSNSINAGSGQITLSVGTLGSSGSLTAANLTTTGSVQLSNSAGDVDIVGPVNGGPFTSTGVNFDNIGGAITSSADMTINHSGVVTIGAALHAGSGGVAISSTSSHKIVLAVSSSSASPAVSTSGYQTYSDPVTLAADTALTDSGGGDITFNSTVDGAFALTVNTGGNAVFGGLVGGTTPLTSLTINDPASGISGGRVQFNAAGTTASPSVVTTAGQTYNNAIMLGANTTLADTGGGPITFKSTVDGAFALTVNTAGATTFVDDVGQNVQLTTLTIDDPASGIVGGPVQCNFAGIATHPTILTTAGQTYNTPIVLNNETAFDDVGGGAITFNSTINGGFALSINTTGSITFAALLGGTTPLASVMTDEPATLINGGTLEMKAAGTSIAPSVLSTGVQTYNTDVTLGANTVFTSTSAGAITFNATIDGSFALTVDTAGPTAFAGLVGSSTALTALTINDPASGISGGTTQFTATGSSSTPSVTTTGSQTYNNAVVLGADTQLTANDGGSVTFYSTVNGDGNGPWNLTIDTSSTASNAGNIQFGNGGAAVVGGVNALASLTTTADSSSAKAGETIFDISGSGPGQPAVQTAGNQTYFNAVVLKADTQLTTTAGGTVGFAGTVDGDGNGPWNLWVDTSFSGGPGNIIFGNTTAAYVGSVHPLRSVTTTATGTSADGTTYFAMSDTNSPAMTTTLAQTYNNPVSFADATQLVATGNATGPGSVTFNSTVDGDGVDVSIDASYTFAGTGALTNASGGNITFGSGGADYVGSTTALATLTTTSTPKGSGSQGKTILDIVGTASPSVKTTGNLTFDTPVVLKTDTVFQSTGGYIDLAGATSGLFALTLDTSSGSGSVFFGGPTRVNTLTVTSGTSIFASDITTTGLLSLQPNSGVTLGSLGAGDYEPTGVIVLGGNLTSTAGVIDLALAGRQSVPVVATIADNPQGGNSVTIQAKGLTVGHEEKITVLGNLSINVGSGTATLGDINTGGNLTVTAGTVVFLLRPSGQLLTASGALNSELVSSPGNPPEGVDVVTLGSNMTFDTSRITVQGTGSNPRFATLFGTGTVPGYTVSLYAPAFGTTLVTSDFTPLDLEAKSYIPQPLEISLPQPQPPVAGATHLYAPGGAVSLSNAFDLLQGRSGEITGLSKATTATITEELQSMFCQVVDIDANGRPTYSNVIDPQKTELIRQDFSQALDAYRAAGHGELVDPESFEYFLETSTDRGAVRTLNRLKQLRNVLRMVADSDLSVDVRDRIEDELLQPVRPNELDYDDLVQIISNIGRPRKPYLRPR
ncbi:MAG: filamentous hemagglutinin N-terminal domain-containing protein [Tepidisphaeraceae bacterium]|jgi:filamentous hemagglutinin family protein